MLEDDEIAEIPAPFAYEEMAPNLVAAFESHVDGQEALKEIRDLVSTRFHAAWDATERYRKKMAENWKLFVGDIPEKEPLFRDMANGHIPISLETISRLAFRVYGELFGDSWHMFDVVAVGPQDDEMANLLSTHGNWQFREQISDFQRQAHRAVLGFFMFGDITAHSWYDEHRNVNRHEILTPDQFVTPYAITTTQPNYSDLPWYAKICPMYRHELESYKSAWSGLDKLLSDEAPDWDSEPDQPMTDAAAKVHNIEPSDANGDTPYKIIWWEGWLDLPNQNRQRWCKVMWDHASREILQLAIHEHWDWQDRIRYEQQQAELVQYRQAQMVHMAIQMQQEQQIAGASEQIGQMSEAGQIGPLGIMQATQALQQMAMAPLPPPPPPPTWMKDPTDPTEEPEKPKYRPIYLFSHAVCIEPFFGNLGIGYGEIESEINRAMDTMLNQFIDAATMNNIPSYLAHASLEFEDEFTVSPGKIHKVRGVAASELPNALVPLRTGPANPQLVEMVNFFARYAESSVQAPNIMSGAPGKSGETAREWAGRLEQATKQLSVVSDKLLAFFVQIFRNNAYLNSIFMREDELIQVTNHLRQGQEIRVGRAMYERNYQVEIRADLKFTSRTQRVQEADEAFGMILNNPYLQQSPSFPQMLYYATKKCFEARGRRDLVQMMGPPPPPPMPQQPPQPGAQPRPN